MTPSRTRHGLPANCPAVPRHRAARSTASQPPDGGGYPTCPKDNLARLPEDIPPL